MILLYPGIYYEQPGAFGGLALGAKSIRLHKRMV